MIRTLLIHQAFGTVSASNLYPDSVSKAFAITELSSSILQLVHLSDIINAMRVSKIFHQAGKSALRSDYGDYKDPQNFDWLRGFSEVAQFEDQGKKGSSSFPQDHLAQG